MKGTAPQRLCLSLFAGLGGGSRGFVDAGWRTVGVELDAEACEDYRLITGHPCHQLDVSSLTPELLRNVVGERPDVVFTSPPCKGFSGCLPSVMASTAHYQELNSLAELGIWLVLEAWADAPPELIIIENVPRIMSRGRQWLDALAALFASYGYGWRESTHDCGELGALAQSRRRFLGVARHARRCPNVLIEPECHPLRTVGDVLGPLPVPGPWSEGAGGPMHELPRLSPMNWLRLALIGAGQDWKALPEMVRVIASTIDPRSRCQRRDGALGMTGWDEHTHAVIGHAHPQNTALQIAEPRLAWDNRSGALGVAGWTHTAHTVIGASNSYHGQNVCDPRMLERAGRQNGQFGVNDWFGAAHTVIATANPTRAWASTNDPRRWPSPTHALVVGEDGVVELHGPAVDLTSTRPSAEPLVIQALDRTWHRPLSTLELAALQGLPIGDATSGWLELSGASHARWRQRIGNAVPPPAARAIAEQMSRTLDANASDTFTLTSRPIWVEEACA